MRLVGPIALAMLCTPVALVAQDATPPAGKPAVAAEKKTCRRADAPTGSLMPGKRVCHTAAEWAAIDKADNARTARSGAINDPGMASVPTGLN